LCDFYSAKVLETTVFRGGEKGLNMPFFISSIERYYSTGKSSQYRLTCTPLI